MKILIYAYGSRGDIQPYLALANALNAAGHQTTLATPALHEKFAGEYGVQIFPRNDEPVRWLERPDTRELLYREAARVSGTMTREEQKAHKRLTKRYMSTVGPELEALAIPMLDEQLRAAHDRPDVIVHTFAGQDYAHFVAEKIGVPRIVAELYPHYQPSSYYPSAAFHDRNWPRPINRLTHLLPRLRVPMKKKVDHWRQDTLGLPLRQGRFNRLRTPTGEPVPLLHMFSRFLLPPAPDWPPSVHNMGFSFLPASGTFNPPPELARFLHAGAPPIAIGFGSLGNPHPVETGLTVAKAVRAAGVRAVVISGGGRGIQIDDPGDDMMVVENVPFAWLLPRVRGMVHGGGIGVTHDALAAGLPTLACPLFREPKMWGDCVHRAGAGLEPIWQSWLTADNLAAALRRLATDDGLYATAQRMQQKIQSEPGHAMAIDLIERTAAAART